MNQLRSLEFEQIGVPVFENPEDDKPMSYGPVWRWHSKRIMQKLTPIGPFMDKKQFFETGLDITWNTADTEGYDPDSDVVLRCTGARKVLEMALESAPFTVGSPSKTPESVRHEGAQNSDPPKETFVLRHDDLDLQNIIVDYSLDTPRCPPSFDVIGWPTIVLPTGPFLLGRLDITVTVTF
jgi:hypothetical protein